MNRESLLKVAKSEKKMEIDTSKGDWAEMNGPVMSSELLGVWYCTKCKLVFENSRKAGLHAVDLHKMEKKYRGKKETVEGETTEENGEPEPDRSNSQQLETEIFGLREGKEAIADTADLALQINVEEEAKYVSALIKNPYVTFTFAKLRDERMIFPDWTLADFLREGALLFAAKLGCSFSFQRNKEVLKADPHFGRIAVSVAEAWEEYDAEKAVEELPAKPVTTSEIHTKS